MKDIKRVLKIAGIICFVSSALYLFYLVAEIFSATQNVFNIVSNAVSIALVIITGSVYLQLSRRTVEEIAGKQNLFFTLTILNIFNSFVVWAVAFWVEIVASRLTRHDVYMPRKDGEEIGDEIAPDDYEIRDVEKTLSERLEEIEDLKRKNLIMDDEYKALREEAINKYLK